jgi:acyl-homoserine-lactone acylase
MKKVVAGSVRTLDYDMAGTGSNALAMNSNITADGSVYLDVNTHQPLEGPTSWFEAHLQSEGGVEFEQRMGLQTCWKIYRPGE